MQTLFICLLTYAATTALGRIQVMYINQKVLDKLNQDLTIDAEYGLKLLTLIPGVNLFMVVLLGILLAKQHNL